MPTLEQAEEQIKAKIRKWGKNAHCGQIIVSEESKAAAIKNEPDEAGRRRTMIGLQTYSPEAYSNWHEAMEYLIERCGYNPILVVDLLLLLIQEAREPSAMSADDSGLDGIDFALQGLWKVNGDYEEKLREAKAAYRARRKGSHNHSKAVQPFAQETAQSEGQGAAGSCPLMPYE